MSRLLAMALLAALIAPLRAAEPAEFFEKRVRPVLVEHCYACHSSQAKEPKSGLRLDSRAAMLKGGARGPAVVPGDVAKSRLLHAISYSDVDLSMPPRGKLPASAIADLTAWVKMGAPWPGGDAAVVEKKPSFDLQKRKAEHWAWHPVKVTAPPAVRDAAWPLVPADRYILAKLEAAGLRPAPAADRATWQRRVYFDLIGLPPTPAEIEQFEREASAKPQAAMARVVDQLLASPHFGERWGRHWLDLVRYAETKGHEFDPIIPNAYQYRDYVIRALNADVPYNLFVTEHLAGDLLPKPRMSGPDGFNESILGTGFWFLGEEVHSPVDIRADECDRIDNKIDVFSKTFLALTVSCARCHDHKFDAISQKDYYALSGFLLSSSYRQVRFDSMEHNKRVAEQLAALRDKYRPAILRAFADSVDKASERVGPMMLASYRAIQAGKEGDSDELRTWTRYLKEAAKNRDSLFHKWALLCVTEKGNVAQRFAELYKQRHKEADDWAKSVGVLSEIAKTNGFWPWQQPWIIDDPGGGFIQDAELSFAWGVTADRPILHFHDRRAVRIDPLWRPIRQAPGTESEHGALGSVMRYGRIIRTIEFGIDTGKVYFLAKGKGRSYAAVDSHSLIAGPLHGRLVRDFDTGGKWQWVAHDLTPYVGQRCHLEISPSGDGEFAVAEAMEASPAPTVEPAYMGWLFEPDPDEVEKSADLAEVEKSAARLGPLFKHVAHNLRNDSEFFLPGSHLMANLVLDRPELFGIKDFAKVREAAVQLFREQAKLVKQIRHDSRLAPAICDVSWVNDRVHIRGSHKSLGEEVPRRFIAAAVGQEPIKAEGRTSGRLELAQQVTDPAINPLIARVIVNRVWHHLFGRGIVASVDNFGVMGDRPTHPELLDFLADRFVKQGWSIKQLIRELVLSQTYRMASRGDTEPADPENKLLHAMRLKRLEGEVIRDSILALAGRLDAKMHGAPVPIYLGNIAEARGKPAVDGPLDGAGRRSVYVAVRRNFLSPFMLAFDTPAPFSTMGRRTTSNVPAQSLILMNDPFVHQQAERWGRRVAAEPGDLAVRVERMYVAAFARRPTAAELGRSRAFIEQGGAWGDLAHVLFNVKEFIYIP